MIYRIPDWVWEFWDVLNFCSDGKYQDLFINAENHEDVECILSQLVGVWCEKNWKMKCIPPCRIASVPDNYFARCPRYVKKVNVKFG